MRHRQSGFMAGGRKGQIYMIAKEKQGIMMNQSIIVYSITSHKLLLDKLACEFISTSKLYIGGTLVLT